MKKIIAVVLVSIQICLIMGMGVLAEDNNGLSGENSSIETEEKFANDTDYDNDESASDEGNDSDDEEDGSGELEAGDAAWGDHSDRPGHDDPEEETEDPEEETKDPEEETEDPEEETKDPEEETEDPGEESEDPEEETGDSEDDAVIEDDSDTELKLSIESDNYSVNEYVEDDIHYLFPTSEMNVSSLTITSTRIIKTTTVGVIASDRHSFTGDFSNRDSAVITLLDGTEVSIQVMYSDLPGVCITLNGTTLDEINSGTKDTKYKKNSIVIFDEDGNINCSAEDILEIKGRGNFTWTQDKKPYQINFKQDTTVLDLGTASKWVLLANYGDSSFVRNRISQDLSEKMGVNYSIDSEWVDLYVDGNYVGLYELCDKPEVGDNSVSLTDDYGILVELDNYYYSSEDHYFQSKYSDSYFVLKSSVADDDDEEGSIAIAGFDSFESYLAEFESFLYSSSMDWNTISSYIDVDSFVKYYILQEICENADGCRSSLFIYRDGENDVLHLGCPWDFDFAWGNCCTRERGGDAFCDFVRNIDSYVDGSCSWFSRLMQIPEFNDKVADYYSESVSEYLDEVISNCSTYYSKLQKASDMDNIIWNVRGSSSIFGDVGHTNCFTYSEEIAYLTNWMNNRASYLNQKYSDVKVICDTHSATIGWQTYFVNGDIAGTTGKSLRLEALRLYLDGQSVDGSIEYRTHVHGIGWLDPVTDGNVSGTVGQSRAIEAVEISLTGELSENYDIYYQVHCQGIGWTAWVKNGEVAGTTGQNRRAEAIRVMISEKGTVPYCVDTQVAYQVSYSGHIQSIGWQDSVSDGDLSGTTGQALRLEAFTAKLGSNVSGSIRYRSHLQGSGWEQEWKTDGEISGTVGKSRRLEAICIELTGEAAEKYDVYYRTHVQKLGWTEWKCNGEVSGTTGQSLRVEAIEIKLVAKDN